MLRHGPKLEKKQVLLGRFVDIGAELFALTAAMAYAGQLVEAAVATAGNSSRRCVTSAV